MHAHMPEITGTDEKGDCLYIPLMDRTSFPVTFQEWFPARGNRIFQAAAPKENSQVVRAITKTTTIEVKEGQRAIWGDIGVVTLQVTMTGALLEHFSGHRQNTLAKCFGKVLEEIPIIRAVGEERLNVVERLIDKVSEIQAKAWVWAGEIIEGVVHTGNGPSIFPCGFCGVLGVGNLRSGCFGEESQDAASLRGRYGAKRMAIFVGYWPGGGKTLAFKMIEHIQLISDIDQHTPVEAVGAQVVGTTIVCFNPVGMVESA